MPVPTNFGGNREGSGRKSTGIKSNELISKMNEQIYQKDNRIQELALRVEELEKDKARLQGDFDRLKTTVSFGSVNSAYNGGSEHSFGDQYGYNSAPLPSLEAKRSKMIEEERDRLRKQVEDLVKSVGNKQEEPGCLLTLLLCCPDPPSQ